MSETLREINKWMEKLNPDVKRLNETVETLNELSISQKKRNVKDIQNAFTKGKRGFNAIKTIAVFTGENPNSQQATSAFNKKTNHSLLKDLKEGNYVIVPAIGKFGNAEHPYAVLNISIDTAAILCGKYEQTSFVFSTLQDNGTIHSEYWEKANTELPYNKDTNNYVKKDETDTWEDKSDASDYYTVIGNKFKYSIPFSIFENVNRQISRNLKDIVEYEMRKGYPITESQLLDFSMNKVGMAAYLRRKAINKDVVID